MENAIFKYQLINVERTPLLLTRLTSEFLPYVTPLVKYLFGFDEFTDSSDNNNLSRVLILYCYCN